MRHHVLEQHGGIVEADKPQQADLALTERFLNLAHLYQCA